MEARQPSGPQPGPGVTVSALTIVTHHPGGLEKKQDGRRGKRSSRREDQATSRSVPPGVQEKTACSLPLRASLWRSQQSDVDQLSVSFAASRVFVTGCAHAVMATRNPDDEPTASAIGGVNPPPSSAARTVYWPVSLS